MATFPPSFTPKFAAKQPQVSIPKRLLMGLGLLTLGTSLNAACGGSDVYTPSNQQVAAIQKADPFYRPDEAFRFSVTDDKSTGEKIVASLSYKNQEVFFEKRRYHLLDGNWTFKEVSAAPISKLAEGQNFNKTDNENLDQVDILFVKKFEVNNQSYKLKVFKNKADGNLGIFFYDNHESHFLTYQFHNRTTYSTAPDSVTDEVAGPSEYSLDPNAKNYILKMHVPSDVQP